MAVVVEEKNGCTSEKRHRCVRFEFKISDVMEEPPAGGISFRSPNMPWLGASWIMHFTKSRRFLQLAIDVNCLEPMEARVGAYLACAEEALHFTEFHTFKHTVRSWRRQRLNLDDKIPRLEIIRKMGDVGPESQLSIHCCFVNVIDDDQRPPPDGLEPIPGPRRRARDVIRVQEGANVYEVDREWLMHRSDVFRRSFQHDFKEKLSGTYILEGIESGSFQNYLAFFRGSIEKLPATTLVNIYTFAHRYWDEDVKAACLTFLARSLTIKNFSNVVEFCLQHKERCGWIDSPNALMDNVASFFTKHMTDIMNSTGWKSLESKKPENIMEVYKLVLQINEVKIKM